MHDQDLKKNMRRVLLLLTGMFLILIAEITYLQVARRTELANHPLNRRADALERTVQRGAIYDQQGQTLAYSEKDQNGVFSRVYPFDDVFAQLIGYSGDKIGKMGIESYCNGELTGSTQTLRQFGAIGRMFAADQGNSIRLTVRSDLQQSAYQALGRRKGAVVVLNAQTGAVLAMVSKPAFHPNTLAGDWHRLSAQTDAPLLNRAAQGLYPPGSIWKTMIADAALREKISTAASVYECPGFLKLDDSYTLYESNDAVHGSVTLEEALARSCNVTFGRLALQLGPDRLQKTFERFGLCQTFDNEIDEVPAHIPDLRQLGDGDLCQVGIGQSSLLVTPLRMAMLAGAFANDGKMMKPYLIDEIISFNGDIIGKKKSEVWLNVTDQTTARTILHDMRTAVEDGTAAAAAVDGIKVAGKTGTAENSAGRPHAWFIGSASAQNKRIAFAVLIENGGGGSAAAAPVARTIIMDFFKEGGVIE